MRLNLGCGPDIRPDYVNVDFRKTHPSVLEVDLSKFPWPWEDASVDEVMMLDFLEHFPMSETDKIIAEAKRVIRKGGCIVIQVPDMEILGRALAKNLYAVCNQCEQTFVGENGCECGATWDSIMDAAIKRIYGGQDYPGNFHQAGFTTSSLEKKLLMHGFRGFSLLEVEHQYRNWNFKAIARKF